MVLVASSRPVGARVVRQLAMRSPISCTSQHGRCVLVVATRPMKATPTPAIVEYRLVDEQTETGGPVQAVPPCERLRTIGDIGLLSLVVHGLNFALVVCWRRFYRWTEMASLGGPI
jgi:hypothetical protein